MQLDYTYLMISLIIYYSETSQLHVIEDGTSKSQGREDQLESALQRIKELQDGKSVHSVVL